MKLSGTGPLTPHFPHNQSNPGVGLCNLGVIGVFGAGGDRVSLLTVVQRTKRSAGTVALVPDQPYNDRIDLSTLLYGYKL